MDRKRMELMQAWSNVGLKGDAEFSLMITPLKNFNSTIAARRVKSSVLNSIEEQTFRQEASKGAEFFTQI
jgi:hypothetical protein